MSTTTTTTTAAATTFKTKINSVSNGCSLTALKEHITTCLQRWRQKHSTARNHTRTEGDHQPHPTHSQQRPQEAKCYCHYQHHNSNRRREFSFIQRTTFFFSRKFQKLSHRKLISIERQQQYTGVNSRNSATVNDCKKGPRTYGRKVEIVAKLLSTTLIAKAKISTSSATEDFGQQTDDHHIYRSFQERIQVIQSSTTSSTSDYYGDNDAMTITDLTFLEIREEYPDLNSEIRSILTARAQDGASISEIRDDYRKLTGLTFPIYEDVTEFLLTIPHVMAYCSEKGTRIFNIMPMEKTKHIHDMVMHQKPQPAEPVQRSSQGNRCYYRERYRTNYQPHNWRHNTSHRLQQHQNMVNIYTDPPANPRDEQQLIPSTDSNLSRDGSEGFFENNCYYQDNCNYLFNRICNQQQPPLTVQLIENPPLEQAPAAVLKPAPLQPVTTNPSTSSALNNFNTDLPCFKNNLNHINNLFQIQQQQQQQQEHYQFQQNVNNVVAVDNRRSSGVPPRSSRSSSPTTKSWYTNDSAYTDSDYEAHLLDFLLLGDDFFLYMARMELRCKFKKNQRVLQSGLCVSGQTIGGAIKRIRAVSDSRRSIIINIGSVDLMQGRQLIQIEHDFRELLLTMLKKGIKPILTTLAPLANYSHNCDLKRLLERFNEFIKREGQHRNLIVIDIWKCLVNEKGHVFFDCYQNEPRNVTGATESYLFWNKIGRQRVLQLIESKLEY